MSGFVDKLRLKGQAEEDTWFARHDRDLVAAMHRRAASGPTSAVALRVVSGGQTGVDRAALDAALGLGLKIGGWCPQGRRAEDGPIAPRYSLRETPDRDYPQRTEWNVRDSDATLILCRGEPTGGTARTRDLARRYDRPVLVVHLEAGADVGAALAWLREQPVGVLNVAGPRESGAPGIYAEALTWLTGFFEEAAAGGQAAGEGDRP